ncbi:MAG: glycosyltransferase family 4 protein [Kiritimatiellae bacterium]|nr:glycosyltransferase family 4 protein [Kiritimatiellia bacterium]
MRVLHFCWEYPPRGSGVGKYIAEISAGLRELGHETIIATSRGAGLPEREEFPNGSIHRIYDESEIGSRAVVDRVLALAREMRVDLIEAVDHLGEAAEMLKIQTRPPVLINCRYNDVVLRARYAQAWHAWQRRAIDLACLRERKRLARERTSIEGAELLAAPSAWMLDALQDQGLRLPERRAVLPKPLASLSGWRNAEAAEPTLLLVGRIDIGKGIGYLPEILRRVARRQPGVVLELAGGDSYARFLGSMRDWLERHLGAERARVRFLGPLRPRELDEAYRRAWAVIVPSRWDTSPTALLEAMARAKPVVASPFGGMSEYLGDKRWIADPGQPAFAETVLSLLEDEPGRRALGEYLRKRLAQEYSPRRAAERFVQFAESALR